MKYKKTFTFCNTEDDARKVCDVYTQTATPYARRHYPAHVTPWISLDKTEQKFIAWTYYRA